VQRYPAADLSEVQPNWVVGLHNLGGGSCHLNACVQLLIAMPEVRRAVLEDGNPKYPHERRPTLAHTLHHPFRLLHEAINLWWFGSHVDKALVEVHLNKSQASSKWDCAKFALSCKDLNENIFKCLGGQSVGNSRSNVTGEQLCITA